MRWTLAMSLELVISKPVNAMISARRTELSVTTTMTSPRMMFVRKAFVKV
jgi:hypothetical protein